MQTVFKIVSEILGQEVTADTSMENTEGWDSLKTCLCAPIVQNILLGCCDRTPAW